MVGCFKRTPFGLTNAVGAFQFIITQIVNEDALVGTYPYLDDVTVAGNSMEELKECSRKFKEALKKRCMTLNENKTIKGVERITILGYEIEKRKMAPDRKRLQPLLELAAPTTLKESKQIKGLFAYYAKYTVDFLQELSH